MTAYKLFIIEDSLNKTIKKITEEMCKENKINYKNQEYKVLFSNEKILFKNNDIRFTSGSKKTLSFYGKIYLNKKETIVETIHLENNLVKIKPENNNCLIVCGGIDNSTVVEHDEELLYFYIAPKHMLEMHDPKTWQTL